MRADSADLIRVICAHLRDPRQKKEARDVSRASPPSATVCSLTLSP